LRSRAVLVALSAAGLLGVVGLVAGADRLPAWNWSVGGVTAEVGPGNRRVTSNEGTFAAGRGAGPGGGVANASGAQSTVGSRHTFATYAEAEAFASKARVHVLAPQWVPAELAPEPLSLTLSALPPEAAAAVGRPQRVAVSQRFVAPDATITVVQSSPPSFFDMLLDTGSSQDEMQLDSGIYVRFGQFPQGVIIYWHERGDVRSVGIIGEQGAAARLTRDDWRRFANSLS
jgi:hypothetical protein